MDDHEIRRSLAALDDTAPVTGRARDLARAQLRRRRRRRRAALAVVSVTAVGALTAGLAMLVSSGRSTTELAAEQPQSPPELGASASSSGSNPALTEAAEPDLPARFECLPDSQVDEGVVFEYAAPGTLVRRIERWVQVQDVRPAPAEVVSSMSDPFPAASIPPTRGGRLVTVSLDEPVLLLGQDLPWPGLYVPEWVPELARDLREGESFVIGISGPVQQILLFDDGVMIRAVGTCGLVEGYNSLIGLYAGARGVLATDAWRALIQGGDGGLSPQDLEAFAMELDQEGSRVEDVAVLAASGVTCPAESEMWSVEYEADVVYEPTPRDAAPKALHRFGGAAALGERFSETEQRTQFAVTDAGLNLIGQIGVTQLENGSWHAVSGLRCFP